MIGDCRDAVLSSGAAVGVCHRTFLAGLGRVAKPALRPELGLEMRPADELCAAVKGDVPAGQERKVPDGLHDLTHDRLRLLVRVLQQDGETADAVDKRGHTYLSKIMF